MKKLYETKRDKEFSKEDYVARKNYSKRDFRRGKTKRGE
jgi:hypothetical protein